MLDASLLARYEDVARPDELKWPEWRAAQLDKVETSLSWLCAHSKVLHERIDMGSLTIGCAFWYLDLRFPNLGWKDRYPEMASWYDSFGKRPSMSMTWTL
jgi:glutathione S-transferase